MSCKTVVLRIKNIYIKLTEHNALPQYKHSQPGQIKIKIKQKQKSLLNPVHLAIQQLMSTWASEFQSKHFLWLWSRFFFRVEVNEIQILLK